MDSENEWEDEETSYKGIPGTIVLINAYNPLNTNTVKASFEATCDLVRGYLRNANKQHLGICIYGTNKSTDIENAAEVFPLSEPSLNEFKKFRDISIDSYGQTIDLKMSDILWHANKMFSNCKKLLSSKTIIMLTRMDLPPIAADKKPTLKRVEDLADAGIHMKILNIAETFYHVDSFYEDFLKVANRGQDYVIPKPIWGSETILKSIQQHSHRHLAAARLSLEIGDGLSIGVGIYKLLQSQTKPKRVIADKETNQILSTATTSYKVQAGPYENGNGMEVNNENEPKEVPLLKSELLFYQMFGDQRIEFTPDEMAKLKNPFGPPKMKLLGFKPAYILCKEKWFLKPCHFLYPNESLIEGSTVAFKALHKACLETSVVAICVLSTRVNSHVRIVALQPTTKPLGLDVSIGFDIIPIPFVENMRNVPQPEELDKNMEEAHKIVMREILKNVSCDYKPDLFENPALQTLYRAIEALALEEEEVQNYVDTTTRDVAVLKSIDAELFEEVFGTFSATAAKRGAQSGEKDKGIAAKKDKVEVNEELLATRLSTNTVAKYTVKQLNDILRYRNLPNLPNLNGLKKQNLVDLVYEHLQ